MIWKDIRYKNNYIEMCSDKLYWTLQAKSDPNVYVSCCSSLCAYVELFYIYCDWDDRLKALLRRKT